MEAHFCWRGGSDEFGPKANFYGGFVLSLPWIKEILESKQIYEKFFHNNVTEHFTNG